MVSRASELLPEPLGPQHTLISSRGSDTVTCLRLCCSAPSTVRWVIFSARTGRARLRASPRPATRGLWGRLLNTDLSASPVYDFSHAATASGGPAITNSPPPEPPSGP